MRYTDLHCDTAYELYKTKSKLIKNNLVVDLEKAAKYERYSQIYAVWSENDFEDDDAYAQFFKVREYFTGELKENGMRLSRTRKEYINSIENNKYTAVLSVEGGKILGNDLERLDVLYENDVRILTLVWNGLCGIGGAFNTDEGLTSFGKAVVKRCESLGIIVDVSHSSEKSFYDVLDIASKPFIASHSNSLSVCGHKRNLTDDQFKHIVSGGGVVGISLCATHIANENEADVDSAINHIDKYLSLGGEDNIVFGFDLDGAKLVKEIGSVTDIDKFAKGMRTRGYGESVIEKIFHSNADRFISSALPE